MSTENLSSKFYEEKPCRKCGSILRGKQHHKCVNCHRERSRIWQQTNPEKYQERQQKWRQDNPEKCRENNRKWRQDNPEKARKSAQKWTQAHPEKVRAWAAKEPKLLIIDQSIHLFKGFNYIRTIRHRKALEDFQQVRSIVGGLNRFVGMVGFKIAVKSL